MIFEIDVSGGDLLSKDYTICIANRDGIIKGFKFHDALISVLSSRYGQRYYRYRKSQKGKANFKVRLYCVVIYYLFKALNFKDELSLHICRDFPSRENDIRKNVTFFLIDLLKLNLGDRIYFCRLSSDSNAHRYAYLMRHDKKNRMDTYIDISLEEVERWL